MTHWLRAVIVAWVLVLGLAAPALSQDDGAPDHSAWEATAERAEATLSAGRASEMALGALRSQLVEFREVFLAAQSLNGTRIETLTQQIAALGPAPGENETEATEIAERRAALNAQLAELRAPVVAAEEAFERADGLIGEIDDTVRERQADELLELGPSPLNPAIWPEALTRLGSYLRSVGAEFVNAWQSPAQRGELRENLPAVLGFGLAALVLLARSRAWTARLSRWARARLAPEGWGVWGFLLSLLHVGVPVLGVYALVEALYASSFVGLRSAFLIDALPVLGVTLFSALWLGRRTFPVSERPDAILRLPPEDRREGRAVTTSMAVVVCIVGLGDAIQTLEPFDADTAAVVAFPLIVLAGLFVYRLGRLIRRHAAKQTDTGEDGEAGYARGLAGALGRAAQVVAILAPVIAAVGYVQAAEALIYPAALTLALLAALRHTQRLISELYALIAGRGDEARDALIPVLIGLALALATVPLLALIWGARVVDLVEVWASLSAGISLGETRISFSDFLTFAVVFAVGYVATRLMQGTLRTSVLPRTGMDTGARNAIVSGIGYVGIFLAAIIAITTAGINLSSLAIVAGALSVGIGFGLQNIVSNFVSGIILLIERPIAEGDWIDVNGNMGYVRAISVRSTRIETFDRTDVIIPNADLVSGTVTNYTRGNSVGRVIVPVGVAYGTDPRKVEAILREIAEAHPMVTVSPPPNVLFMGFGADSLDFEIRAILTDVNYMLWVKSDMNFEIAARFEAEGIEIPFAQRDVWLRNPEMLTGEKPADAAPKAQAATPAPAKLAPRKDEADPQEDDG